MDSDLLFSNDIEEPEDNASTVPPWNIVIIDDDREVHAATRLVLADVICLDRPLAFYSLYSAREAREALPQLQNIAAILLDVVMETDDAGLQLVRYIREDLAWEETRIILRTGQPGSAPERAVILDYDINDYKSKAELTEGRLFTTMVAALRSYRHLVSLSETRQGLRKIITAASSLNQIRSMGLFAEGVLLQVTAILGNGASSVLCTQRAPGDTGTLQTLAGSGRFKLSPEAALDSTVQSRLLKALETRCNIFTADHAALYFCTLNQRELVIYVEGPRPFNALELSLLEMFGHNIAVGYDNVEMYEQLVDAKRDLEHRVEERTRALSENEARLRIYKAAVDHSAAAILITDTAGLIRYTNPALTRITLYENGVLIGQNAKLFHTGQTSPEALDALWENVQAGRDWRGELLSRRQDGSLYWEDVSISPVTDGSGVITHCIWVKDDISARKRMEDDLRFLATTDSLTGALNRRSFLEGAQLEWERRNRLGTGLSVVMLDIDHFKRINDTHGHQVGDDAICATVRACSAVLREHDLFGRLGGEEFGCILPGTSSDEALAIAERLRQAVAAITDPVQDGIVLTLTISLGIATAGPGGANIEELLRRADASLYRAKQAGRNCVRLAA